MLTDPKYLLFLPVLVAKIPPIQQKYAFHGSKPLLSLAIIFENLFTAVRENTLMLASVFLQKTQEPE